MLTVNLAQRDSVAIKGVAEPQQCGSAVQWNAFPWVSTRQIGFTDRPVFMRRFGAHMEGSQVILQVVCFGFEWQSCVH
jgi:hypothetical protein